METIGNAGLVARIAAFGIAVGPDEAAVYSNTS
jgi:hypothetical protein